MQNLPTSDRFVSRKEASAYLLARYGISRTHMTLAKLAVIGGGPVFRKVNARRAVYRVGDLDVWAGSIMSGPMRTTSEAA
jgi:hypothetical protein